MNDESPIRSTMLPYGQQWLDDEDIQAVIEVLRSDFITQGPTIERFEQKVAAYTGSKYARSMLCCWHWTR
jgi:perosamine synthetase